VWTTSWWIIGWIDWFGRWEMGKKMRMEEQSVVVGGDGGSGGNMWVWDEGQRRANGGRTRRRGTNNHRLGVRGMNEGGWSLDKIDISSPISGSTYHFVTRVSYLGKQDKRRQKASFSHALRFYPSSFHSSIPLSSSSSSSTLVCLITGSHVTRVFSCTTHVTSAKTARKFGNFPGLD
jgi:hypothetical protein